MTIWLDAQLPQTLALWLAQNFAVQAKTLQELGLRQGNDHRIFMAARLQEAVIMTKDRDFRILQAAFGAPPQIIHLAFGNTTNMELERILAATLPDALALLQAGEKVVVIGPTPPIALVPPPAAL